MKKMLFKKTLFAVCIAFTVCFSLLLSACNADTVTDTSAEESTSQSVDVSNPGSSSSDGVITEDVNSEDISTEDVVLPQFEIDYASTDLEANYTDPSFVSIYLVNVQITASENLKDFRYISISYNEKGEPYAAKTLYETALLAQGTPFVAQTYINPKLSGRGISYTDGNGNTRYALIKNDEEGYLAVYPFNNPKKQESTVNLYVSKNGALVPVSAKIDGTAEGIIAALVSNGVLTEGTKVNKFYIANEVAHIDLSSNYIANSTQSVGCVVNSLLEYFGDKGVERVFITVNGKATVHHNQHFILDRFGNEEDDGKHYALLWLFDVHTFDMFPFPVSFDGTAEELIAKLVKESNWNPEIKVNSFEIKDGKAYIDLNEPFGSMVNAGLTAESGVDCVIMTLESAYVIDEVVVSIEGEPFKSSYV